MPDEGFHEIQLNGKQLVFLFMAATVVAVVVFLSGVMVGRGVQIQGAGGLTEPAQAALDPTAAAQVPALVAATASPAGTPISAQETLTYPDRLKEPTPAVERLKAPVETASAGSLVPSPAPERPVEPAPVAAVASGVPLSEPAGRGFVVQVAAVRARDEADTIARRLTGKGYPAFVTTPAAGPRIFRVRVGRYDSRREAESVAGRLEREEQFKPWITR